MKLTKLLFLLSILITSIAHADWVKTPDYMYRSDCERPSSIVFMYQGANAGPNMTEPEELGPGLMLVIDDLVSYCTLVVIPLADRHELRGHGSYQVWDFSDDFTHGGGVFKQQDIIDYAQWNWPDAPTYLLGGSAGAFMAYRLANDRRIMGLPLAGLVMIDGASPYAVSTDDRHARYEDNDYELRFSTLGMDYYMSAINYVNLGFHTWENRWGLDTLIVNSHNDTMIRDREKDQFATLLGKTASQLQTNWAGEAHNIGPDGYEIVRAWFKARLSSDIVQYSTIYKPLVKPTEKEKVMK